MRGSAVSRLAFAGALASIVAGCGGGSSSPSVASMGTTIAGGSATRASYAFAPPPGGVGIGTSMSTTVGTGAGTRYAACMRAHGLPSFPDPDGQGTITITVSTSLDPSSPVFRDAAADCDHLLPPEKRPSPALQQRMKQRALAFAACMRSHGVPNYPDPTFSNGGVSQGFDAKNGVDPSSPAFKTAQKDCGRG